MLFKILYHDEARCIFSFTTVAKRQRGLHEKSVHWVWCSIPCHWSFCQCRTGCGSNCRKAIIAIPESIDGDELALVQKYAPQIPKLCPGFKKYESELNSFSIENNYYIDILFTVPENSSIPTEFMVHGHTCYLEISKDGKYLVVPKRACQSLCLGKDMNDSSGDLKIPLE